MIHTSACPLDHHPHRSMPSDSPVSSPSSSQFELPSHIICPQILNYIQSCCAVVTLREIELSSFHILD